VVPVSIQPIDLQAGAKFLAAPAATAFEVKNVHERLGGMRAGGKRRKRNVSIN
jgi:hypothetical protein